MGKGDIKIQEDGWKMPEFSLITQRKSLMYSDIHLARLSGYFK